MLNQFSRTELLLGKEAMNKLENSRVAVFGIGGVGGYVCEALARSGVYSEEQPIRPIEDMAISCRSHCICPPGAKHKCTERRDIPGSVAFVPSVVGLIIAGEVIKDLTAECRRQAD